MEILQIIALPTGWNAVVAHAGGASFIPAPCLALVEFEDDDTTLPLDRKILPVVSGSDISEPLVVLNDPLCIGLAAPHQPVSDWNHKAVVAFGKSSL